jgi:alanine-glyoxylate transaminase / serine-glyoxylate transaminase / serine-pyruvate transaminase
MDAYMQKSTSNKSGFAYHTTMPTDALRDFHQVTVELLTIGTDTLRTHQHQLGQRIRTLLREKYELRSVAAPGYEAPGVLVYYSPGYNSIDNPKMMQYFQNSHIVQPPLQIAMGVPWKLDYEPNNCKTFRIGLFGIDKLLNMTHTIETIDRSLYHVLHELHTVHPTTISLPSPLLGVAAAGTAPAAAASSSSSSDDKKYRMHS